MGKLVDDTVLDGALNIIKNNATKVHVCSTQPTNYTEANATYMLAQKTGLTTGDFTGPADHTSGRKLTMNQQAAISVTNGGSAQHIALTGTSSVLYYVTTCTAQTLTAGNTVTIPAWIISIADPS